MTLLRILNPINFVRGLTELEQAQVLDAYRQFDKTDARLIGFEYIEIT